MPIGASCRDGEVLAQLDDQLNCLVADRLGRGFRPPGTRLERRLALGPVPGDQPADPALRDAVLAGYLTLSPALYDNGGDDQARLRPPPTVPAAIFLWPETRHSDVLKPDTSERASPPSAPRLTRASQDH